MDERRFVEGGGGGWGVLGYNAGRTTNQALKTAGKVMLAVIYDLVSVQVIASLGGEVKPLALTPPSFLISWKGT